MEPEQDDLRERTFQFARRIVRLCSSLPRSPVTSVVRDQLLCSGTSGGANYREARRGRAKAEFLSKAGECLRELDESLYWIELIEDENFLPGRFASRNHGRNRPARRDFRPAYQNRAKFITYPSDF